MRKKGEVSCSLDDDTESNFNGSIMDSEGVVAISKPADLEKFYREGSPPVNKVPIKRKHKHSPATSIDSTGTFVKQNDTSVDSKRQALEQPVPSSNFEDSPLTNQIVRVMSLSRKGIMIISSLETKLKLF
ncbi:hypothetical protein AVEN_28457-1 [Araneus ventricosus]|uniref:Uncharacterized protein n=1 Tax=Araneus ventricosus TaxID=182803 RepID=A0A4Y2I147_ARAVE|nr:hypothetical protein AVEN_28457-1 [Araneus ventricosus]